LERARGKWRADGAGAHYSGPRWGSAARRDRDPARIAALLARHLPAGRPARILDAPCGTGRLFPALARHGTVVGADVSVAMLASAHATSAAPERLVCADLTHLPFADRSFDAVVCCRLLHHLERERDLARVVGELVRVSAGPIVATYWDAASLPEWRRRVLPTRRAPRRFARPRARLEELFEAAGAPVVAHAWSLRFLSRQAYLVARPR
jgi:SAM-dependent methyltransferase